MAARMQAIMMGRITLYSLVISNIMTIAAIGTMATIHTSRLLSLGRNLPRSHKLESESLSKMTVPIPTTTTISTATTIRKVCSVNLRLRNGYRETLLMFNFDRKPAIGPSLHVQQVMGSSGER